MSEYIFEGVILPEGSIKGEGVLVKREEIVRCRDCKEFEPKEKYGCKDDFCLYWCVDVESRDGFCAWGKRRETC